MADDDVKFSWEELQHCAQREVRQRKRVYPRLVHTGKMTQAEADKEIAMMQSISSFLATRIQPSLRLET
jgi:hypothetical protein